MDTKALRQKVLDLAIRGKLVPQNPEDEPASVLLERIRAEKQQMVKDGKLKPKDVKNDTVIFRGEDNLHYEQFRDGTVKCIEDEIPFEVPEGWAWTRIGTMAFFLGGYAYKSNKYVSDSHNLVIRIGNIKNNNINPFVSKTCISDEYASETPNYLIFENDILFTMTGTRGKRDYFYSCRIDKNDLTGLKLFLNQRVGCLRLFNKTDILPSYFVNAIQSSCVLDAIFATETGNVNQGNIGSTATMNLLVPIPPAKEQKNIQEKVISILSVIEQYDIDSENLLKVIQIAKGKILDLAIRGQLVPQDPNDEPAFFLLEHIRKEKEELMKQGKIKRDKKESIIFRSEDNSYYEKIGNTIENIDSIIPFELPDNWQFIRFKEIWELISGRDLLPSEYNDEMIGVPYVTGASNFNNGRIELVRWTPNPQVITHYGDLLITCKGTIGEMAFNDFGDAHIARQIMAIRNRFNLNLEYLSYCIHFYINSIKASAKGLIPGISREDILNLILPIPPKEYQERMVSYINNANLLLFSLEKSLI